MHGQACCLHGCLDHAMTGLPLTLQGFKPQSKSTMILAFRYGDRESCNIRADFAHSLCASRPQQYVTALAWAQAAQVI